MVVAKCFKQCEVSNTTEVNVMRAAVRLRGTVVSESR